MKKMKTTIGYQAENQFFQAAKSKAGLTIGDYIFTDPVDNRSGTGYDFECDVHSLRVGTTKKMKIEVKTSHNNGVDLTPSESMLAQLGYGDSYLIVVYKHAVSENKFLRSVIPLERFERATKRISLRIPSK